jgi:hypothetical protein
LREVSRLIKESLGQIFIQAHPAAIEGVHRLRVPPVELGKIEPEETGRFLAVLPIPPVRQQHAPDIPK